MQEESWTHEMGTAMCVYSKYVAPLLMKTHLDVCQLAIDSRRPPVFTGPL